MNENLLQLLADYSEQRFFNGNNVFVLKTLTRTLEIQDKFVPDARYLLTVAGVQSTSLGQFQNILKAEKL